MTRRRISNRTPRELTAKERSALSDVVLELDSDFRVKTGSVDDVSQVLPEAGVIVLNELDGRMYYADDFGWHRQGDDQSPVTLFIDYTDTQFAFKFKAPATSTLTIYDGDGTVTEVAGNDSTEVTHTTDYSEAGIYYFYVVGDVLDITFIQLLNPPIRGDISGWSRLINLTYVLIATIGGTTEVYGDVSGWSALTNLTQLIVADNLMTGDVSGWSALTNLTQLRCYSTLIHGDISGWSTLTNLTVLSCYNTAVSGDIASWSALTLADGLYADRTNLSFNSAPAFPDYINAEVSLYSINNGGATSEMVDNMLESFAATPLTGCTIRLDGNNAPRTSASDAAYATVNAANTLTVNQ